MNWQEYVLAIAYSHKNWAKADAAFLVDQGVVYEIGEQSSAYTYDTPVVNILQNLGVGAVRGKWLYCTYKPSEMDLGMACMRQVSGVTYASGGSVYAVSLSDESGPGAPAAPRAAAFDVTKRPNLNPTRENPGGASRWSNLSWVDGWFKWLEGNNKFIGDSAWKFFDSYLKRIKKPMWDGRPTAQIEKLESILGEGLTDMKDVIGLNADIRDRFFMVAALALVGRSLSSQAGKDPVRGGSAPGGHNVGGILLNSSNKVIAWGINMMSLNGTFHAETGMVLAYLRRNKTSTLPDDCRLYTTLQPCHMCSGFIATVAKNITVVIGQKDPKISNSALAMGRGDNVKEVSFAHALPQRRTLPQVNWNLGDVLEDLIAKSGSNAIPFLYSRQAAKVFEGMRNRPDVMDKVVKELCHPAPLTITSRTQAPGLSVRGLDLAGSPSPGRGVASLDVLRRSGNPLAVQQVADMQKRGGEVKLSGASRNIQGLDLEVRNINASRHLQLPNMDKQIKPLVQAMAEIQDLLTTLKSRGLIEF